MSRAQAFLKSGTGLGGLIVRGAQVGPPPVTSPQRVMGKQEERHFSFPNKDASGIRKGKGSGRALSTASAPSQQASALKVKV